MRFKLHYGMDPDTDGKSLYLWDMKKHRMVRKIWRRRC